MRTNRNVRGRRDAFTLIELLVVIAIIGVLVGMTVGGVQRIRLAATRATASSETNQLAVAVQAFLRDKKVNYIPSRIRLRKQMNYNLTASGDQLDKDSYAYLRLVWPQVQLNTNINWSPTAANDTVLEGDQCLVFFLGGIPEWDAASGRFAATGFHKNPQDPAGALATRGAAYFEFKNNRLRDRSNPATPAPVSGFPSYFDAYEGGDTPRPYAYFSSFGRKNGYNPYGSSDCASLGISPYRDPSNAFYQPTGFQIICAGGDQRFGAGGVAPSATTALGQPDADNVTNFSNGGQISNISN